MNSKQRLMDDIAKIRRKETMKKIISLILALILVASFSTTALASETVNAPGTYYADVYGTTVKYSQVSEIKFCVEIAWTGLNFTYHAAEAPEWDTTDHTYIQHPAYWEGEGTITVTNHSNTRIVATTEYVPGEEYKNASMVFDSNKLKISSAVDSNAAQTGTIVVTPDGYLPKMNTSATIGTIKMTIAQDIDVTIEEAQALSSKTYQWYTLVPQENRDTVEEELALEIEKMNDDCSELNSRLAVLNALGGIQSEEDQTELNRLYQNLLTSYNDFLSKLEQYQ